jgi:hypothetical protein
MEYQLPMVIPQPQLPVLWKKKRKTFSIKEFVQMYREPVVTYSIIPNNAPETQGVHEGRQSHRGGRRSFNHIDFEAEVYNSQGTSELLLNTINGLFSKFYAPERVRLSKDGVRIKLNDLVSYKIAIINGEMKFYLTVPQKWAKAFTSAIKRDWGQVDITKVKDSERIVDFNPKKAKAMEVHLRHHYALSIKHGKDGYDSFYSSLASLASTLDKGDKILIDYNIEPINDKWKENAVQKIRKFKEGKAPSRDEAFTVNGVVGKVLDMFNTIFDEFTNMIEELMGAKDKKDKRSEQMFELKYSDKKAHANTKGYKMQVRVLGESEDEKKIKYAFRNIENAFSLYDGDNKFSVTHIKTKRGIKSIINAVEHNKPVIGRPTDIYFEKEMDGILKLPSKQTLKEYSKVIQQDNFTRTEVSKDFFNSEDGAIPFGQTLEKETRKMFFGGYRRDRWSKKGRYVKDKTRLDDRSTATMVFGTMGSGKTSLSENQALYTFGTHIKDYEQWKQESKSVVVFDVADGAMINNIYNHVPDHLKDRVVILNHANFTNPIAVNNADLAEFNTEVMKDEDYAYTLAEMEAKLVMEILKSDKTLSVDRWFVSALQAVHTINKDWGYIEAMRTLIDDAFRQTDVMPNLTGNRRLSLEMKTYDKMAMNGDTGKIVQTIENRFAQLERDQKLWDCIAQRPLRNEDGKCKLNFRTLMDGDEDGAYMVLIYIPKSGVSQIYRKFLFAHYFTKVWNVLISREVGFGGREYRPETLIIMDEIHQIIDIPIVAKLFIDIFKEPRKYSGRYWFTLHGWSSLAKAGRGLEGDIKQSIMDNGCNLIMLKGGGEAFSSLSDFLQPMTIADFNNLMNMDYCGIFALRWKNKNHVFQAKMIPDLKHNSDFSKHRDTDSDFLVKYSSPYGRAMKEVRDDNLDRSYAMIEKSIMGSFVDDEEDGGEDKWEKLEKDGMKEKKSKRSRKNGSEPTAD